MPSTIFDKTTCLSITFHMPGRTRHANKDKIDTEAEKSELVLSKRIFDSDNYRKCIRIAVKMRDWLESRALPSPLKEGTYLIPSGLIDQVEAKVSEMRTEYAEAADAFIAEYPELIEQWRDKLKEHFDASNYPPAEVMRRRFWVQRIILDFQPARPDDIDQRQEIEDAILEIKAALRQGLLDLVSKLAGMLSERKDGKKRGFRSDALEEFNEWMQLMPARLVVDDDQLKTLAEKAKKLLAGKSLDELRDMDSVRDKVRIGLEKVSKGLSGLLKEMPKRSFGFDD